MLRDRGQTFACGGFVARDIRLGAARRARCTDLYHLERGHEDIRRFFEPVFAAGKIPLTAGGDHSITYPIFQAMAPKEPIALVHIDAHTDTWDCFKGSKFTPGTGTPEIGGLTTRATLALLRGLEGLNWVSGDVVEVSPPYDPSGNTALIAATLMYEMLCLFARRSDPTGA
ncbi:arginase family protein [Burkholderia ubonensis]|uniref:arginase family protein n=1 Tax=Burkholderia ubonensis TaxID=101571 RepID=UPI000AB76C15